MSNIKVLVGCEESQRVCKSFRENGFEAYSCDLLPTSGHHPDWHFKEDIFEVVKKLNPDVLIAFPPCTFLTVSANAHFLNNPARWENRLQAVRFVHRLMNLPIKYIAIENPVGVISSHISRPDQIIQPFQFGDPEIKKTCLWLKNLPLLNPTNIVEPEYLLYKSKKSKSGFSKYGKITGSNPSTNNPENAKLRSKTYPGIAKAMAEQWGRFIKNQNE